MIPKAWQLIASYQYSTTVQAPILCRQTTSLGVKFNYLEAEEYSHISDVGNIIHSHVLLLLFADSSILTSINPHSCSHAIFKSVRSWGAVLIILAVAVMSSSGLMITVSVAQGVCVGWGIKGTGINLYDSVQKWELWSTDLREAL